MIASNSIRSQLRVSFTWNQGHGGGPAPDQRKFSLDRVILAATGKEIIMSPGNGCGGRAFPIVEVIAYVGLKDLVQRHHLEHGTAFPNYRAKDEQKTQHLVARREKWRIISSACLSSCSSSFVCVSRDWTRSAGMSLR